MIKNNRYLLLALLTTLFLLSSCKKEIEKDKKIIILSDMDWKRFKSRRFSEIRLKFDGQILKYMVKAVESSSREPYMKDEEKFPPFEIYANDHTFSIRPIYTKNYEMINSNLFAPVVASKLLNHIRGGNQEVIYEILPVYFHETFLFLAMVKFDKRPHFDIKNVFKRMVKEKTFRLNIHHAKAENQLQHIAFERSKKFLQHSFFELLLTQNSDGFFSLNYQNFRLTRRGSKAEITEKDLDWTFRVDELLGCVEETSSCDNLSLFKNEFLSQDKHLTRALKKSLSKESGSTPELVNKAKSLLQVEKENLNRLCSTKDVTNVYGNLCSEEINSHYRDLISNFDKIPRLVESTKTWLETRYLVEK